MVNNIMLGALAWASSLKETVVNALTSDERGQDLVEYAVLVGGIALVAGIAIFLSGGLNFNDFRNKINDCITFTSPCSAPAAP